MKHDCRKEDVRFVVNALAYYKHEYIVALRTASEQKFIIEKITAHAINKI
jgi:hypothetical protein